MSAKEQTRKGKRAQGIGLLGIPISHALKADIRRLAQKSGMTSAAWCRLRLQEFVRRSTAAASATKQSLDY